jgi:hypothetical protein
MYLPNQEDLSSLKGSMVVSIANCGKATAEKPRAIPGDSMDKEVPRAIKTFLPDTQSTRHYFNVSEQYLKEYGDFIYRFSLNKREGYRRIIFSEDVGRERYAN